MLSKSVVSVTHRLQIPGDPRDFTPASLSAIQEMVQEALSPFNLAALVKGRSVLIKPNLVRPRSDIPTATTTDPRVLIALLRLCRDAGASRIGLGDKPGIGLSCRGGQQFLGIDDYLTEVGAHFVYFDESEEIWEDNPRGRICNSIPIPRVLREYEVLLNVPKLKLHMHTGISLGIKNLFGLVPEHFRMKHHREDLHRFLIDYLYLVKPSLTLIDGIWALEGQAPICGTPVKDFNTLIAATDIVAGDSIGTSLMGINPREITMLRMAQADGFGNLDHDRIEVIGTSPQTLQRHFTQPVLSSQDAYPGFDVIVHGGCVGCLSSLRHALDRLNLAGKLRLDPQTILLGLHHEAEDIQLKSEPGKLWCYGNCCLEQFIQHYKDQDYAHLLEGCPPHFMEFYRQYCKVNGIDPNS
ncbi:MAG: DUF362 domain-containing protein [bacterium]|nr:DUF362 domain-containing protein [bacterium]